MKFVITNGDTYIGRSPNNQIISTPDIGDVSFFDTEDSAKKSIACLPKALQYKGYIVKKVVGLQFEGENDFSAAVGSEMTTDEEYEKEITTKTGNGFSYEIDDPDWLANLKSDLLKVDEVLGSLPSINYQVTRDLSNINKELTDLEHAIEFLNPNAVQAFYLENDFKKLRQKRRSLKDAKYILGIVLKFRWIDWGSGRVPKLFESMKIREYMPRVRRDLFE